MTQDKQETTFALDEQIEADKKLLAGEEVEKEDDEEEPEEEDDTKEEKEEPKEEPKLEPKPVDNEALARARWENSELKRQLAEQNKAKEQPKVEEKVPDATEDPLGYLAYENKKLKEQVESVAKWKEQQETQTKQQEYYAAQVRGFNVAEEQFKSTVPDYEEVSAHMVNEMKKSFRHLYPTATQQQIDGAVANKIIDMAEQAAQRGEQPVGYLYNLSKTVYGYQPKPTETAEEKPKKPALDVIEKNKKKSAHGLGGQGSAPAITPEAYANMSISDMEKYANEFYSSHRA